MIHGGGLAPSGTAWSSRAAEVAGVGVREQLARGRDEVGVTDAVPGDVGAELASAITKRVGRAGRIAGQPGAVEIPVLARDDAQGSAEREQRVLERHEERVTPVPDRVVV